MTDPGFADRTYLEPLDLEGVAGVLAPRASRRAPADARRADGAQPRRDARRGRRARRARRRADRRRRGGDRARRGPRALPGDDASRRPARSRSRRSSRAPEELPAELSLPGHPAAGVHARRPRRRDRRRSRGARARCSERGLRESPVGQVLVEESLLGWDEFELEVMRDAKRQRRRRLLDREPRPDGRPHGRLGHRRAPDDAFRRGLPGAARRGRRRHPRRRRRDGRLQHPVRARARDAASCA